MGQGPSLPLGAHGVVRVAQLQRRDSAGAPVLAGQEAQPQSGAAVGSRTPIRRIGRSCPVRELRAPKARTNSKQARSLAAGLNVSPAGGAASRTDARFTCKRGWGDGIPSDLSNQLDPPDPTDQTERKEEGKAETRTKGFTLMFDGVRRFAP